MKTDIFNPDWCEIVFEDRNKEYGAYELRQISAKNSFISVLIAVALIGVGIVTPFLVSLISDKLDESKIKVTEVTTLAEPPPIDKNEPPPPPVEPPPPLKNTVKFTPPVVVKDELAVDTVRAQDELKEVDIGVKTQTGDSLAGVDLSLLEGNKIIDDNSNTVFTVVEQMPEFPGGEVEMLKYIVKNTHYPQIAKGNGITGKVFLTFVVDKEGKVGEVAIVRGIGGGCDEEAMRVVKSMPHWKPGKQNGRPALVRYTIPINFTLR